MSKKRREPDPVAAIIHKGIRYSAPLDGYAQCGGFVTARDDSTNELLWSQSIYSPKVNPNIEDDKLDVFITSMILVNKGDAITIRNEHRQEYILRFDTREIRQVND